jgi:hypothetical protein
LSGSVLAGARRRLIGGAVRTWRAVVTMPRGARLVVIGVVVAAGFAGIVFPLFSNSGAPPQAVIAGQLPETARVGQPVRVDIAVDNVGDGIIYPVCISLGGSGATLVSANFQGLDQVTASGNRVCGGQLTGQETISITLVVAFDHRGSSEVTLVPEQGATVIGPVFRGTVGVS